MLDFDLGDIYEFAPLAAMIGWVWFIIPILPESLAFLGPIGMGTPIVAMVVTEQMLQWTASKYTHIRAICRPSDVELDLYFTTYQSEEIEPNLFSTVIPLKERVKHPYWQLLEYVTIKHWGTLEDRFEFGERKVKFKHQEITHGRSAVVTLYEESASDVDHLKPVPTFYLTEAPRDYHDPADRYRELVAPMLRANGGQMLQTLTPDQQFDIEKMQGRVADLEAKCTEYKRQAMKWHAIAVKGEQVIEQLKNELHAVLSAQADMIQAVVEQVLKALAAHVDIHEALKSVRGRWGWIDKRVIMLVLAAIVVLVIAMNPQPLAQAVQQKEVWLLAVIGIIVAGAVIYHTMRRR